VAAPNDGLFRALCRAIGRDDLAEDPRYASNAGRVDHRAELVPELEARFRECEADDWVAALDAAGVPVGKVRSVPDALAAAEAAGRPATLRVDHPTAGPLELVASPIWTEAAVGDPVAPPLLGQHTRAVLRELGRTEEQIDVLAERGTVLLGD